MLFALLLMLALTGCKKGMNSDEIYEKCSSGVVFIINYFYYSVTLPNGAEMYFTGISDNGELEGFTFDEDKAIKNSSGASGTGFFISNDGLLLTNRHVAAPEVPPTVVKGFLKSFKRYLKESYREDLSNLQKMFYQYEGDIATQQRIAQKYKSTNESLEAIDDMDMNDADIEVHSDISIVYNNSFITKREDLHDCHTVAVSDDEAVDLAIIQLADMTTPADAYIFPMCENNELTMDDKLFMIGYNMGLSVSKTEHGIRSQCYSGYMTQKSDGVNILYSIPSQHGSSGSPVVNEYGEVVAVNFAGIDRTQSFNYGIPLKKVKQFLKDN